MKNVGLKWRQIFNPPGAHTSLGLPRILLILDKNIHKKERFIILIG
jgi:hypothetical protein